jgi:hypothetical protein
MTGLPSWLSGCSVKPVDHQPLLQLMAKETRFVVCAAPFD